MTLEVKNFGKFPAAYFDVESWEAPNGAGKTTLLNAYLFAFTGKTQTGFVPIKVGTMPTETTFVCVNDLDGLLPFYGICRKIKNGETFLYVNGDCITQSYFEDVCAGMGINLELLAACADANILTDPQLTAEQLRKLLIRTGVMDGGESLLLRKEQKKVREKLKQAQQYALSNVTIPQRTAEPLSDAERAYLSEYAKLETITNAQTLTVCQTCGRAFGTEDVKRLEREKSEASAKVKQMQKEVERILVKKKIFDQNTQDINDAQRLINLATNAKRDVVAYELRLGEIETQLYKADAQAIRASLPEGVEVVTEKTTKTAKTSSTCTLTYQGVPLKSVNRGKRVELCVRMLDKARAGAPFPIIIDNAESVQGLDDIPNLIRLSVE